MRSTIAVVCVPVVLTLIVSAFSTRRLPLSGDEPHYLIMADSIASDFDLDLHNNYLNDFNTHRIIGLTIPHVYNVERGWMPGHQPGLSMLIAPPFKIGGITGARLALCLFAGLLPLSLFTWFRARLERASVSARQARATAAWLTLELTISVPILLGLPDLRRPRRRRDRDDAVPARLQSARRGAARLDVGAVLADGRTVSVAAREVHLHRRAPRLRRRGRDVAPESSRTRNAESPRPVHGAAGHRRTGAARGVQHVGVGFAARLPARERTDDVVRTRRGDFSRAAPRSEPGDVRAAAALPAGVAALPFFAARHRGLALLWGLVYLSLILPNALVLTRYGGDGPDGRFSWSAAWLWAVPIGFVVADEHARLVRWVRRAAIGGWIYQAALAARWLRAPDLLFPTIDEGLHARDSLVPVAWHARLPSYYFWDFSSYWTYRPNVAAMLLVAALLVLGIQAARAPIKDAATGSTGGLATPD